VGTGDKIDNEAEEYKGKTKETARVGPPGGGGRCA
jgi:hypothetical protein